MPITLWEDIAGKQCACGNPATHYYGGEGPICCNCHVPGGEGLVSPREAAKAHIKVLTARGETIPRWLLEVGV